MFQNQFVVSIRNENGEILRESRDKEVFLPFNSHYSLLLKNNNNRKAVAEIFIDGTKVLGKHKIIIDPHSSVNLERFCIDGDLSSGNKFKFVKANHSDVQDPTSSENGIIKVVFTLEKESSIKFKKFIDTGDDLKSCKKSYSPNRSLFDFADCFCENIENPEFDTDEVGATVEGSASLQTFKYASIGELEKHSTIINLKLKPSIQPVTVKETRVKYCDICGHKNRYQARFCSNCGTSQTF
jgi:hypothetical protein